VLGIKGNQKNFYQDAKLFLDDPINQKKMNSKDFAYILFFVIMQNRVDKYV